MISLSLETDASIIPSRMLSRQKKMAKKGRESRAERFRPARLRASSRLTYDPS